ncbi:hypothetical protein FHX34_102619 [Actinoplanes teichomyceticus]|uniref:Uncharacterized protein n=1 Tax=Actinoplanes teichomyceticus TaxID=1867 RepID=A0A561WJK6_ACTTI|nr:hypothetical protein FHX34_102619 [Actinoplanes teichomyceticus]
MIDCIERHLAAPDGLVGEGRQSGTEEAQR